MYDDHELGPAWSHVAHLPVKLQRRLALRLLLGTLPKGPVAVVCLRQFPADKQARMNDLMDQHNEGMLGRAADRELRRLMRAADQIMLANARELARASTQRVATLRKTDAPERGAKSRKSRKRPLGRSRSSG